VQHGGTEAQKQAILPPVARGEWILGVAVTESDYGWRPEKLHMHASMEHGHYVLNGTKLFVYDAKAQRTCYVPYAPALRATALVGVLASCSWMLAPLRVCAHATRLDESGG